MLLKSLEFLNAGIEFTRTYTLGVFLALLRPIRTYTRDAIYGIDLEELQGTNGQQDEHLDLEDLLEEPADDLGDDEGEGEGEGEGDVEEEEEEGADPKPDRLPVFSPLDCSPLSFFDNFLDIGGVPMFILGKDEWTDAVPEFEEPVFDETAPQKIALPPPMEEDLTWTISCCKFSANGSRIATGHCDGSVRLWDADHGVPLQYKEKMHESTVGDVSFRGENGSVVLSCGSNPPDGSFVVWDSVNDLTTRIDASENWLNRRLRHPKLLPPTFSEDGLAAIFPVRSCAEGRHTSDEDLYNESELTLLTKVVAVESAIELKKNDEQVCWFFVLDTWAIPGLKHLMGYCSIPILHDFTLTSMNLSPDGKSLMVGFMNLGLSDGFVVIWPDYRHKGTMSVKLDGTMGAWSPRSELQENMAVTWTVPADILPEEGSGGACFLWKMDALSEWATDNSLQPLEMISHMQSPEEEVEGISPDVLRSRWGGDVLWCDFVKHYDGNLRVVSCNVSDRVDIVFWDTISLVATHRLTPEVGDLQMTLGNKEMWHKKWLVGDVVRGLQPLMVSRDRAWLTLVDGALNKVYIWNGTQAVEVFRLAFPAEMTMRLGYQKDIILGRQPGKFVLLGSECMIVGATRPPYQDGQRGSLVTSLKYADSRYDMLKNHPVGKFSHNGGLLGLVHPFSMVMHVWDLDTGQKLPQISSDWGSKFVHFAFSQDGKQMVAYMSDNVVKLWELAEIGTAQPAIVDSIQEDVESRIGCTGLGFSWDEDGQKTIVACEMLGSLVWWRAEQEEEEVESVQEKTRSWSTVKDMFHSGGSPNRISSSSRLRSRSTSWVVVERLQADGQHACRFSSDGLRAVLLGKTRETVVWDLVRRVALKRFKFEVPFERTKLFFPEHVPMTGDHSFVGRGDFGAEFQKCHPSTTVEELKSRVVEVPRNMFVSEDGNWVLYDEFVSPENRFRGKVSMSTNTKIRTVSKLLIADTRGHNRPLEVMGSKLAPSLLLIMSPDGRRVACMTSKYTVKVWCAYSASGLIPDFKLLKSSGRLRNKQFVKELLQEMGPSLLNYPDHSGLSVLYRALLDGRDMMRDSLLRWALKNSVKVRILQLGNGSNASSNALEFALKQKSPGSARTMIRFALLGAVHDSDLAVMLQESLVKLGAVYPKILLETLEDPRMTLELGTVQVPDFIMARREFLVTTDARMRPQKEKLQGIWKELTKKFKQKNLKGMMLVPCIATVIPYPDAAQIGKRGVLRNLLLARADHNAFSALPIKVIIWFKWKMFARRMLLDELWHYGLLLLCFTTYSIQLGKEKSGKDIGTTTILFLLFSSVLAGMNLLREFKQMIVYTKSHGVRGFLHWVTSGWNWIEIFSYILLMAVLPLAHFMDSFLDFSVISSIVAVSSIMLWWKILYYAKAFVSTGPVVIMIGAIIQDITFFLVLAFMVLFGFGVAFFVLYRGLVNDRSLNPELTVEELEEIEASFSTVPRSLMTMFAFMLGDFNLASIYGSPAPGVSVFLFLLYMMIMAIVLLNLLIAVMGDSFARIKNSEEKEFLKARASAIDDVESMMSTHAQDRLQKDIYPFLHMLMPKEHKERDDDEEGHKKVLDMQMKLKHDSKYNMRASQLTWRRIEDEVKNISLQIQKLKKREASEESEGGSDYAAASFGSLTSLSTWVGDHPPEYSSDTS